MHLLIIRKVKYFLDNLQYNIIDFALRNAWYYSSSSLQSATVVGSTCFVCASHLQDIINTNLCIFNILKLNELHILNLNYISLLFLSSIFWHSPSFCRSFSKINLTQYLKTCAKQENKSGKG